MTSLRLRWHPEHGRDCKDLVRSENWFRGFGRGAKFEEILQQERVDEGLRRDSATGLVSGTEEALTTL
jgi:hypothetical protein